jgi:hypothetical protein
VNQRLLVALADVEPVEITGAFERHTSLKWDQLQGSQAGGRWGAPGAYEVLYLGRPRDSVVVEAYRHLVEDEMDAAEGLGAQVLERRVITCEVQVPKVLDLRSSDNRARIGLSDGSLRSEVGDYEACQAIGAAAHQLQLNGIIAPAATGLGETLALFAFNLPVEQWPVVTATDIWRGLPADPRRLRLAGEGSSDNAG